MKDAPKDSPIWTIVDGDESKVNGRTAFDAMRAGDPVGKAVVDEYIKYLSVGLTDMINIFQPAILCIGGGICNEGETLLAPVRAFIDREQYAMNSAKKTKVCKAQLGNDAGIIGAALLGKQEADFPMSLTKSVFGMFPCGKTADAYTLKNASGVTLVLTNYGCRILQLLTPDKSGKLGDVVLGHATLEEYLGSDFQARSSAATQTASAAQRSPLTA